MTSQAALMVSPRLSATMPKATAPSAAMAIHKSFDWVPFRTVARLLIGVLLVAREAAAGRRAAALAKLLPPERGGIDVNQPRLVIAVPTRIVRRVELERKPLWVGAKRDGLRSLGASLARAL